MNTEIVIVGGGFGGVRIAKILAKATNHIHITIIDKSRYHTFYPDLYEVATANLSETYAYLPLEFYELKSTAAYPLDDIFSNNLNVTVVHDEVIGTDFRQNRIVLRSGGTKEYDYAVLSVGSDTNYYNIPGLYEYAFPLKNLWDAMSVRNAIDELFFNGSKKSTITLVIGGGGFTGCEFTGELSYFVKQLAKRHGHSLDAISIVIVEGSSSLLSGMSPWVQAKAKERLESLGVKIIFNFPIKSVQDKAVVLGDGSLIPFDMLIWTAGVRANKLTSDISGPKLEKGYCIAVDTSLHVSPFENVFGVGDMTYCVDTVTGKPMSMTAMTALSQANIVAKNIQNAISKKPLKAYKPSHPGFIIPLGGKFGIIESHGFCISGIIPWLAKRLAALHYWSGIIGWKKAISLSSNGIKIFIRNDRQIND